jgi:hypothetical protein
MRQIQGDKVYMNNPTCALLTTKCYQDYNISNINGGGDYAEPGGTLQSERDIINDDASGLARRRFGGHVNLDFRPAKVSPSPGVIASGFFIYHAVNQIYKGKAIV